MARRSDRRREWAARLARWRTSGSSIRQFCRAEGVSEPSFFQWRRRLSADGIATSDAHRSTGVTNASPTFVPLEVLGGLSVDTACVEIRLPSGISLRVPEHVAEARVAALLRLLRHEAPGC